jgi:hypothetical protein
VYKSNTLYEIKGKLRPITGYEGVGREQGYGCALSLTLSLDGCGWLTPRPSRCAPWEAGWASVPVWTGAVKRNFFAPTGVRTANCSARRESLYKYDKKKIIIIYSLQFLVLFTH